ncbi:MAG: diacylglycerol kinase family lipid kinase [Ruminococcaceae bacterium]|nr:diacylglycerol kinase family lipid kinase [Oscillospiraceae bacterium]
MKKLMFIVNPVAGRMMYKGGLGEALRILSDGGYLPTVYFTNGAGDAATLVRDNSSDYDLICCMGGDGTLSEVVSGLLNIENAPPIGYFPLGTANDVATTLGIPKNNPAEVAKRVLEGKPMPWDVGVSCSSRSFTYVAAFGAFTDVSYETPQESKQALGHLAYMLEGLNRIPRLPKYKTRVIFDDKEELEDDFIFGGVTNSTSVAGFIKLNRDLVKLDDGKFEVALVKYPMSLTDVNLLVSEVLSQNYSGDYFKIIQASKVRFIFEEDVPWTHDGEDGGTYKDVTFSNIPGAVKIIA